MAVYMLFPALRYVGLSTDPKPTSISDVREGDIFREYDTHFDYIWDSGDWRGPIRWLGINYTEAVGGI